MWKFIAITTSALLLGACATVPQPLTGQFANVSPKTAATATTNQHVRWGGAIVETVPGPTQTCIYALSRPLDSSARPYASGPSSGRFVACHKGFYDPEIFTKDRQITVTGVLEGTLTRKVGNYDYPYPRVAADVIYLWPMRAVDRGDLRYPYYDPFWSPLRWGPGWYPRSVIIVERHSDMPKPAPHK